MITYVRKRHFSHYSSRNLETNHFHCMEKSIFDILQNIPFVFHTKKKVMQAWKYIFFCENYSSWCKLAKYTHCLIVLQQLNCSDVNKQHAVWIWTWVSELWLTGCLPWGVSSSYHSATISHHLDQFIHLHCTISLETIFANRCHAVQVVIILLRTSTVFFNSPKTKRHLFWTTR